MATESAYTCVGYNVTSCSSPDINKEMSHAFKNGLCRTDLLERMSVDITLSESGADKRSRCRVGPDANDLKPFSLVDKCDNSVSASSPLKLVGSRRSDVVKALAGAVSRISNYSIDGSGDEHFPVSSLRKSMRLLPDTPSGTERGCVLTRSLLEDPSIRLLESLLPPTTGPLPRQTSYSSSSGSLIGDLKSLTQEFDAIVFESSLEPAPDSSDSGYHPRDDSLNVDEDAPSDNGEKGEISDVVHNSDCPSILVESAKPSAEDQCCGIVPNYSLPVKSVNPRSRKPKHSRKSRRPVMLCDPDQSSIASELTETSNSIMVSIGTSDSNPVSQNSSLSPESTRDKDQESYDEKVVDCTSPSTRSNSLEYSKADPQEDEFTLVTNRKERRRQSQKRQSVQPKVMCVSLPKSTSSTSSSCSDGHYPNRSRHSCNNDHVQVRPTNQISIPITKKCYQVSHSISRFPASRGSSNVTSCQQGFLVRPPPKPESAAWPNLASRPKLKNPARCPFKGTLDDSSSYAQNSQHSRSVVSSRQHSELAKFLLSSWNSFQMTPCVV